MTRAGSVPAQPREVDDTARPEGAADAAEPCKPRGRASEVRATLRSTADEVRATLQQTIRHLTREGLDGDDSALVEVALAEVLNNIVEHAYAEAAHGWIQLECDLLDDRLVCRIDDGGTPMPEGHLPEGRANDLAVALQDLPEGGFGWFLIRNLAQELHYVRKAERNSLSFVLPRNKTG